MNIIPYDKRGENLKGNVVPKANYIALYEYTQFIITSRWSEKN